MEQKSVKKVIEITVTYLTEQVEVIRTERQPTFSDALLVVVHSETYVEFVPLTALKHVSFQTFEE